MGFMSREKSCTCIESFAANLTPRAAKKLSKVWNKEACTTICKDVRAKHEASIVHREALEHEHACHVVKVQGGNAGADGTLYFREML